MSVPSLREDPLQSPTWALSWESECNRKVGSCAPSEQTPKDCSSRVDTSDVRVNMAKGVFEKRFKFGFLKQGGVIGYKVKNTADRSAIDR